MAIIRVIHFSVPLSNEKYVDRARLLDYVKGDVEYLVEKNSPYY